ncbi:relaxase domain-containing protein, partial [Morganella morganii]|uniref:relaxase domain-containing protein n=1 Tax=Morganella morganii TaxID=582 RepID=UPI003F72C4C9
IASVVGYYADAKDDYYSKDSSFTAWHGQGAEALGLSGEVSSQRFKELLVGEIASVVGYYADAKDDYYSKDSSFTAWHGQGAEAL